MKLKTTLLAAALVLALAACAPADAGTSTPTPADGDAVPTLAVGTFPVEMRGFSFIPQKITIKAGSTVIWTNMDFNQHDLHADNGAFASPLIDSGKTFRFTFAEPGTFAYYCALHGGPNGQGMSGVIQVVP